MIQPLIEERISKSYDFVTVKLLVVSGYPFESGIHSEVIAIGTEDTTCQELSNSPYLTASGTGGFLQNEILVCGAVDGGFRNLCWILGQDKNITMEHGRRATSGIIYTDKVSILIPYSSIIKSGKDFRFLFVARSESTRGVSHTTCLCFPALGNRWLCFF